MALIQELLALTEGKNDTYEYELILKDSKRKVIASKKITGNFAEDILEDELGEFMEDYPDAVETQVKKKKITKEGVEGSPAEKAAHDFLMKKYGDYAAPLKPLDRSGTVYFQVKVPTGDDGGVKVWSKSQLVFLKVKGSQVSTIAQRDFKELTESLNENDEESDDEPKYFDEIVDEFIDKKNLHNFEGSRGLRNLDILAKGLGYRGGSSEFFEDNSGAIEAVVEWIKQFGDRVPEWKESLESVLGESLSEAKNHMGETEYSSFASWKAAVKKKHPDFWIDGDKDIAQAMVGEQPFKRGKTKSVGEWDGSVGTVF